jgi:hypothetical protein
MSQADLYRFLGGDDTVPAAVLRPLVRALVGELDVLRFRERVANREIETCAECGEYFDTTEHRGRFCSAACARLSEQAAAAARRSALKARIQEMAERRRQGVPCCSETTKLGYPCAGKPVTPLSRCQSHITDDERFAMQYGDHLGFMAVSDDLASLTAASIGLSDLILQSRELGQIRGRKLAEVQRVSAEAQAERERALRSFGGQPPS